MNKAAPTLTMLMIAFALEACVIFPVPGKRSEAGMPPSKVKPHTTTRAKLLKNNLQPVARTPDDRFFLYGHTVHRGGKLCVFILPLPGGGGAVGCDDSPGLSSDSQRWVLVQFGDSGVVKEVTETKCEGSCESPQVVLPTLLNKTYGPTLAANYQQMLEHTLAFHQAAGQGDVQAVEKWLARGVEANARDPINGRTSLHEAASQGRPAVATLLLAHGADVNARDNQDRTPLHEAARQGNDALVEALLVHGADVNARDNEGRMPLHKAVNQGDLATVKRLLAHGAVVNAKDESGIAPLYSATFQDNPAMINVLLAHGADVNTKDSLDHTALDLALVKGFTDAAGVLRAHGGRTTVDLTRQNTLTEVPVDVALFPGATQTTAVAQLKTAQRLVSRDEKADPECHVRKIVDTKIVKTQAQPKFVGGKLVEGLWTERWYMDRCGRSIPYTVSYKPDGKGDAEIILE